MFLHKAILLSAEKSGNSLLEAEKFKHL